MLRASALAASHARRSKTSLMPSTCTTTFATTTTTTARRWKSFKAFIGNNTPQDGGHKIAKPTTTTTTTTHSSKDNATSTAATTGGGFSNLTKRNAKSSWRNPPAARFASHEQPQQQHDGSNHSNTINAPPNMRGKEWTSPPWNNKHSNTNTQINNNNKQQQQQQSQRRNDWRTDNSGRRATTTAAPSTSSTSSTLRSNNTGEDLRDISLLRSTFMKNIPSNTTNTANNIATTTTNPKPSWRNSSPPSAALGSSSNGSESSIGGASWRPSRYNRQGATSSTTFHNSNSGNNNSNNNMNNANKSNNNNMNNANNNEKSIEQVLKQHAQQRKYDMENRYRNAGERVPYHTMDEMGNNSGSGGGGGAGRAGGFGGVANSRGNSNNSGSNSSWRSNPGYSNRNQNQNYNNSQARFPQQQQQQQQRSPNQQQQQQQSPQFQRSNNNNQQHKYQQQAQWNAQQTMRNTNQRFNNRNNNNNNNNSSYNNKNNNNRSRRRKKHRPLLPPSAPTQVALPSAPLTLVDLSLLLRVRKRTIVRTLRSLGEPIAYSTANQDSFTIDPELMEYIAIDLGIEPIKMEKRRKEGGVEEAERRAMRLSSYANEYGDEGVEDEDRTEEEERYAALPPRSPVVSIMGHVDHGKTTLMDALRRRAVTDIVTGAANGGGKDAASSKKSSSKKKGKKGDKSRGGKGVTVEDGNVAGTEAGGITQVITAFEVPLPLEDGGTTGEDDEGISLSSPISTVTFLDTPGHAAFKKMRQSGSSATDVIVLVVAADDGVSPQTVEIIEMYKSIARSQPQSISLVVAVSKVDKPGIDIDEAVMRIENQLIEHEIFTENVLAGGGEEGEFGACQLFPVSGVTGEGLDDLVEGLALQSEIMDLRADDEAKGEGIVIDARMEKGLGVVADCVIRWGKVECGDFVVSGTNGGRVKFLNDVANKPLKRARPSQPVRIVGFKTPPKAGDPIVVAASEDEAKELIRLRESELNDERAAIDEDRQLQLQVTGTAAKQNIMMQRAQEKYGFGGEEDEGLAIRIPVVVKADSNGALEAVRDALLSIGIDSKLNIVIDPVAMSTGVVTTSDVRMARESDAAIFVFGKVGTADKETKVLAETEDVSIRNHAIIYRLLEDAKEYFGKYLPVEHSVKVHGKAGVQAVFEVTDPSKKSVSIAGLRVMEGSLFKEKSKRGSNGEAPLICFYRVLRKGELITPEADKVKASSLRKVKEDVDNVRQGDECGLGLEGFNDLEEGDVVECYSIEEKRAAI